MIITSGDSNSMKPKCFDFPVYETLNHRKKLKLISTKHKIKSATKSKN